LQIDGLVGLFDRDVFLKLISADLWDTTVRGYGIARAVRLPSCTVQACTKSIGRWFPDAASRAPIIDRIAPIVSASEIFSDELQDNARQHEAFVEILNTPDIDVGEALLVVAAQLLQDPSIVLTGDKRFIKSLKTHHPLMFAKVRHQLVSFEGCVLRACETDGTASVIERLRQAAPCDNVIRMALGGGPTVDEKSFMEAFTSFDPLRPD
jgi:hypothetical protein